MAKKFLVPLNLANLTSDPENGTEGEVYFNTTLKQARIYLDGEWTNLSEGGPSVIFKETQPNIYDIKPGDIWVQHFPSLRNIALGGTITEIEDEGVEYIVHTFESSGQFIPLRPFDIEYFILAGGGGGATTGSGGGAGGLLTGTTSVTDEAYPIIVGGGGTGGPSGSAANGVQGTNTEFNELVALGGGFGKSHGFEGNGQDGGCGGGGQITTSSPQALGGVGSQGFNGGNGLVSSAWSGGSGGGGGTGQSGSAGSNSAGGGKGGNGAETHISGFFQIFGGGGGGAWVFGNNLNYAEGGYGGGGRSGVRGTDWGNSLGGGEHAFAHTGSGGGGGSFYPNSNNTSSPYYRPGGNGSGGIVIIRYRKYAE